MSVICWLRSMCSMSVICCKDLAAKVKSGAHASADEHVRHHYQLSSSSAFKSCIMYRWIADHV